jgi:hypothetical protein
MAVITDIVDLVHPGSDSMGNILSDTIWVLFDREIDEASVDEGNFLVEGPDTDSFIGPDVGFNLPNVSDSGDNDQLNSPGYKGIVPGKISFQRINIADTDPHVGNDTAGTGNLWRTKAIFTPNFPLQKLTEYKIYLAGDEIPSDSTPTGIRSRTVFDVLPAGGNTGNGILSFGGSYIGLANDTYHIKITTVGAPGIAQYTWWKSSDVITVNGPVLSDAYSSQELDNGVTVRFKTNSFNLNDLYTAVVKLPVVFSDNTYWVFTTGTGSIAVLPDSVSTSIIGGPSSLVPMTIAVSAINPADRATNLPLTTKRITLTFTKNVLSSTVTAASLLLTGAPVNGDESIFTTREIYKDITVTGNKIILDI